MPNTPDTPNAKDSFGYSAMISDALREVVRQALQQVQASGMPEDHHLYITFKTTMDEVALPLSLRQIYPESMTIVLQFQFYNLRVGDKGFSVTLSFGGRFETLYIPFTAIEIFSDPLAQLVLNFTDEGGARIRKAKKDAEKHSPASPATSTMLASWSGTAIRNAPKLTSREQVAHIQNEKTLYEVKSPKEKTLEKSRAKNISKDNLSESNASSNKLHKVGKPRLQKTPKPVTLKHIVAKPAVAGKVLAFRSKSPSPSSPSSSQNTKQKGSSKKKKSDKTQTQIPSSEKTP